jgi:hypothetical protein
MATQMPDASWSGRLRRVTELERPDHHWLGDEHECYFAGEYTPRAGYAHSKTNGLVNNLKKKPSLRGTNQWPHKLRAIREVADVFSAGLKPEARSMITFVPIPPSKPYNHPEYDDRMTAVARAIASDVDVRELIRLEISREAAHETVETRDPDELRAKLAIILPLLEPRPRLIALLDDLLTTGCSFRACQTLLAEALPDVPVIGLFVARRVPDRSDVDADLDALLKGFREAQGKT